VVRVEIAVEIALLAGESVALSALITPAHLSTATHPPAVSEMLSKPSREVSQ
jgi:hypothetical protein